MGFEHSFLFTWFMVKIIGSTVLYFAYDVFWSAVTTSLGVWPKFHHATNGNVFIQLHRAKNMLSIDFHSLSERLDIRQDFWNKTEKSTIICIKKKKSFHNMLISQPFVWTLFAFLNNSEQNRKR